MSTYKVSVSNNTIKVDAANTKHETKVTTVDYSVSLSRVGGQGSKGDSADTDFEIVSSQEGDVLIYDATVSKFKNHQLTTSKVLDIDNTGKAEGAVLVYDATAAKYQATTRIEKQETLIIGGSF